MRDMSTALAEFNACIDHDKANQDRRFRAAQDGRIVFELNEAIDGNCWPMLSTEQCKRLLALLAAA